MFLTNSDMVELIEFRHRLHAHPEVSGEERWTADAVVTALGDGPDEIVTGIGGYGVAAVFNGEDDGPTVMFRSELDALPIAEIGDIGYKSTVPGKGHLCGHDGHTAILTALARGLERQRPARGRVVLMFQPAEETGAGAAAVIADPKFAAIAPDYAFALHNYPGVPLGEARISPGPSNCASRGMRIVLSGRTAHASAPETGISPVQAVAELAPALTSLSAGSVRDSGFRLATITHARIGEPAFGIAPGYGEVWVTLRTLTDDGMDALVADAEAITSEAAARHRLGIGIEYHDIFHHCENDPEAVDILRAAFDAEGIAHSDGMPMRASEDFGLFGRSARSAMFMFGSGETYPQLHNPDFDFPDALIEPGARIFMRVARDLLG